MGITDWFSGKKGKLRDMAKEAVSGGKLTKERMAELEKARQELETDSLDQDRTVQRREIFNTAVEAVKSTGRLTATQEVELKKIQDYLKLRDEDIDKTRMNLRRLKTVDEIQRGKLPEVSANNAALRGLKMNAGETAHFCVAAELLERATSGDEGVRVNRDAPYDPGSCRGQNLPLKDAKDLGDGFVILTNQRFVYKGGRTLAHGLEKPEDFFVYEDGVRLAAGRLQLLFQFKAEGQAEIFGSLLTKIRE
jgi:hypothetical protein